MAAKLGLTVKKEEDFSEWFIEVLSKAEVVDKRIPDSRGFYGYPSWGTIILERLEGLFKKALEATGHKPIRTPTVIPETLLKVEERHAKGFIPEGWVITHGRGGQKLEINKLLRPTGETIIYSLYKYWVRSYRDLPLKRYEVTASYRAEPDHAIFPLLRSHQFYWLEAHDVQSSYEEADKQIREDMHIFEDVAWNSLAIPFFLFKRPDWDKFAGAEYSCAYDVPLPSRKVLQLATTHNLGRNFSKAFGIKFIDESEHEHYAYQTCFGPGISRILGGMIALHGDDRGLVLPPAISPIQIIIIPIIFKKYSKAVLDKSKELKAKLVKEGFRVFVDDSDKTAGWKFNEWELKGVPIRIEIGPEDLRKNQVTVVKRVDNKRLHVKEKELVQKIRKYLEDVLKCLQEKAKKILVIDRAESFEEIKEMQDRKSTMIEIAFCDQMSCVEKLKEINTKVRGILLFKNNEKTVDECELTARRAARGKKCAVCGMKANRMVVVSKQY
jgi:prolyl-tRNA synthetase